MRLTTFRLEKAEGLKWEGFKLGQSNNCSRKLTT